MKSTSLPSQLRICLIAYKFPILGRASDHGFLWPIARGLAQRGHQVTVIAAKSPLGKQEVQRDKVQVFYLHEGYPNYSEIRFETAVYQKFLQLHRENPFHLVHSIDKSAIEISRHKDELKVAVAYDVDATQMSQLFSIMGMVQESFSSLLSTGVAVLYKFLSTYFGGDRQLLKTADGIFVTNPQQRIFLERYYLYPDFHIYSAPYGVELGDLSPRPEALDLKRKLKIADNAHIVVTITDMMEPKEVINLLIAFERVAVKKPNSCMLIIGNGPGWKEIEFAMLNLALGSKVFMLGALKPEEISDCISTADVFVNMSSRSTGFEPAMIEAMAQKKVIIGSEVSPISNVVEDGRDGFLLRPADTESLAHLLIEIFSGGLPTVDIGERACEKVTNLFDTKKMVQSIEDAYQKILLNTKILKKQRTRPSPPAPEATAP
ncbi:MAG: glycosyltransferase family 4 protein [Pseudobdellovibrionaceae bacterium]